MDLYTQDDIEDWVLKKLSDTDYGDAKLHFMAARKFLPQHLIYEGGDELDDFSLEYEEVIENLSKRLIVAIGMGGKWMLYDRHTINKFVLPTEKIVRCIYILEFRGGCKVGISGNFRNRFKDYCKPWCLRIKSVHIMHCDEPVLVEQVIKRAFKDKKLAGSTEFFTIKPEAIIEKIIEMGYRSCDIRGIEVASLYH